LIHEYLGHKVHLRLRSSKPPETLAQMLSFYDVPAAIVLLLFSPIHSDPSSLPPSLRCLCLQGYSRWQGGIYKSIINGDPHFLQDCVTVFLGMGLTFLDSINPSRSKLFLWLAIRSFRRSRLGRFCGFLVWPHLGTHLVLLTPPFVVLYLWLVVADDVSCSFAGI
jgi:hypothetical protein